MHLNGFHCARCGACCRWEGPVRLSEEEIDAIAEFLGMGVSHFLNEYTVLAPDRRCLSLTEREDGSCIFYDDAAKACRINDAKPKQCRDFPYRWRFPGWEKLCAGAALMNGGMK